MNTILKSKGAAWAAISLVILVIALTFSLRTVWWAFFDVFFAFMAVFCQLIAVYILKYNNIAGRKLQKFALIFCILTAVALIGEFIAFQFVY